MKKLSYIVLALTIVISVFTGCKKYLDINTDPNRPTEVSPPGLLPSIEGSIAYSQGGDVERYTSVFVQYITGYSRQFFAYNRYIFTEEDFNNLWNNMYAENMKDLDNIIDINDAAGGELWTTYGGIARILMAYSLGIVTDMWGDVPYDEAFQGLENLQPGYNTQEDIYNTLQSLLDEAIDSLTNEPGDDVATPFAEDNIYNGDVSKWIQLAYGLKARFYIHLKNVDAANAQSAIDAIDAGGLIDNGSDAQFGFSSVETASNPWYQYINNRDDITYSIEEDGVGNFATNSMAAKGDPRYTVYIDVDGSQFWGTPGYLGSYYGSNTSPVIFFSYAEQEFIEAEALNKLGDAAGAETALQEGIRANMEKLGVDEASINTYIDANADTLATGSGESQLAIIIYEKYIANYLHYESWTDWRRTGYPALTVNTGVLTEIPRRFIYPTNENKYNPNIPTTTSTLLSPALWWDTF